MGAANGGGVVAADVVLFAGLGQVRRRQRLEPDEDASQPCFGGQFEQTGFEQGAYGRGTLKQPVHSLHAAEQSFGEPWIAEQVVVEEVEVPTGQRFDVGQRVLDALGVEADTVAEESRHVAEVAAVRTAARHRQGVGHQVEVPLDQVTSDGCHLVQASVPAVIAGLGAASPEVGQEARKHSLARAEDHRVGMLRGLVGQRRGVQSTHADVDAARPVSVGDLVGTACRGDVHLQHHQIGLIVE